MSLATHLLASLTLTSGKTLWKRKSNLEHIHNSYFLSNIFQIYQIFSGHLSQLDRMDEGHKVYLRWALGDLMALSLPLALDDQANPGSPTNCRHRNVKKSGMKACTVWNIQWMHIGKAKSHSWACDSWATDVTLHSSGALWAIYWHKDEWQTPTHLGQYLPLTTQTYLRTRHALFTFLTRGPW